jgi:uncharacterized protein (TIGR02996 family)
VIQGRHLLAAAVDRPWDEAPRLVLADWLDENTEVGGTALRKSPQKSKRDENYWFWFDAPGVDVQEAAIVPMDVFAKLPGLNHRRWMTRDGTTCRIKRFTSADTALVAVMNATWRVATGRPGVAYDRKADCEVVSGHDLWASEFGRGGRYIEHAVVKVGLWLHLACGVHLPKMRKAEKRTPDRVCSSCRRALIRGARCPTS